MPIVPRDENSILQAYTEAITTLTDFVATSSSVQGGQERSPAYTFTDVLDRLQIWASDTEAVSGRLDYKLRDAPDLRDRVLSLLRDLADLEVDRVASSRSASTSAADAADKGSDTPNTNPRESTLFPLEPQVRDDRSVHSFSSIDTSFTPESLLDSPLTRAYDTVSFLMEFTPSLLEPFPYNRFVQAASADVGLTSFPFVDKALIGPMGRPNVDAAKGDVDHALQVLAERIVDAAQSDINHVEASFPEADSNLAERLGRANWERRQSLRDLRAKLEVNPHRVSGKDLDKSVLQDIPADPVDSATATGDEGSDSSDSSSESSIETGGSTANIHPSHGISGSSSRTMTARTRSEFQFSANVTQSTGVTEPSRDAPLTESVSLESTEHFRVPKPPSPNESFTGKTFVCPFCAHEISDLKSPFEWKKHVVEDLEPYMCTYKDCTRPAKTYGSQKLWWQHEKNHHRVKYAWICSSCLHKPAFKTSTALDQHIMKDHSIKLTSLQLHSIRDTCRSEMGTSIPSRTCPLCQETIECKDESSRRLLERAVRKHVSEHLEQLAYFVAVPAGQMLVRDDDSELQDDSDSEYGLRSEIQSVKSKATHMSKKQVQLENIKSFIEDQTRTAKTLRQIQAGETAVAAERPELESISTLASHAPAPIFPIQTMVHPPNEHFYARESLLPEAHNALRSPGLVCIFHGVGGVGKTLAAVEYVYKHKEYYDAIFWLQADTGPGLAESYLQMALSLGLFHGQEDQNTFIDKGRIWLQTTERRWLLVFDNAVAWEDIARYMPNSLADSNGSVLLTTQHPHQFLPEAKNVTRLRLEPVSQNAGADMLMKYLARDIRTDPEKHLAKEISARVGGLPVAIGHVAGYVGFSGYSLEELIETFREWRKTSGVATDEADDLPVSFLEDSFSYDAALAMVWEVTLRELTEDARRLMNILAYLSPASVPQDMIWRVHEDDSLRFLDSREKQRKKRIYTSLTKRRLVTVDADSNFSIHRSLQRGLREELSNSKTKQQAVFDQAVALVREVFPQSNPLQQPTPESWSEYQKLLPHLEALNEVYHEPKTHIYGSIDFAQLLLDAGMDQFERGIVREGLLLLNTAEKVLDASPSPEDHRVMKADIHAMIGIMYDTTGIQQRAEAFYRRKEALAIRKRICDASDPPRRNDEILLYNSYMEYAISLLHYHRWKQAEPIIEMCLAKFKEWGPEEEIPFEYSKYHNKIALVRMYQGRFKEAIKHADRSVDLMEKKGFAIFKTRFEFDMACIILQSGDLDRALELHREIYTQRFETVGITNELSLHSMYAVGAIYELKEDYDEAELWFRKALDQRRSVTSWPDEAFSRAQYHLSRVLLARDKPEDTATAESLRDKALAVLHRLLPHDTPRELENVTDEAVLFDHMLPISPGGPRFTGLGLLQFFMPRS